MRLAQSGSIGMVHSFGGRQASAISATDRRAISTARVGTAPARERRQPVEALAEVVRAEGTERTIAPDPVDGQRKRARVREAERCRVPVDGRRVHLDPEQPLGRQQRVQVPPRHVCLGVHRAEREPRLGPGDRVEERDAVRIVGIEDPLHRPAPEPDRAEQVAAVDVLELGQAVAQRSESTVSDSPGPSRWRHMLAPSWRRTPSPIGGRGGCATAETCAFPRAMPATLPAGIDVMGISEASRQSRPGTTEDRARFPLLRPRSSTRRMRPSTSGPFGEYGRTFAPPKPRRCPPGRYRRSERARRTRATSPGRSPHRSLPLAGSPGA